MPKENASFIIEDAQILYPNFSGVESRYNRRGARNFCLFIDDPMLVQRLTDEGWNIKYLKPRDPDDVPRAYTQCMLRYPSGDDDRTIPPKVILVTGEKTTMLDEESLSLLDRLEIVSVDVVLNPYHWSGDDGTGGVKGYVHTLYAVVKPDPFESKYAPYEV